MARPYGLFDAPIMELIRRRRSWRTFTSQALTAEHKDLMQTFIDGFETAPFSNRIRVALFDEPAAKGGIKGTYGVIRGATTFLVGAVSQGPRSLEDFGYVFEAVLLRATDLGLGTCWMGGTFSRSMFGRRIGLGPSEVVPAISPVGYRAGRRGAVDALFSFSAGSAKRKPWHELFFHRDFKTPLSNAAAGAFGEQLEMVRLAPSAANKQPWRLITDGDAIHFLLERTPGFAALWAVDLQRIDMGIAMCHFELCAREAGLKGRWETRAEGLLLPKQYEYSISWVQEG